jgi:hypothetical protein
MATCSVKTTAVADGLRLILFRFYLGILSALATASTARMTVSTRSSYQLLRKHSGSRRYSRDPCCPTPPQALRLRAAFGWNAGCGSSENTFYRSNRRGPNLCNSCLPTFAGKVTFGSVRATSAADLPTLAFTGVARKGWVSPACGPLSTVAMPEICPRSLIQLTMVAYRLELAGNSVLRSVITPFCQMKTPLKLPLESKVVPNTWPWLLMPEA